MITKICYFFNVQITFDKDNLKELEMEYPNEL